MPVAISRKNTTDKITTAHEIGHFYELPDLYSVHNNNVNPGNDYDNVMNAVDLERTASQYRLRKFQWITLRNRIDIANYKQ